MTVNAKNEICLLIQKGGKTIWCLNSVAFFTAQPLSLFNPTRRLKKYLGSRVIFRDGRIQTIKQISSKGFSGKTFFSKLESIFLGGYDIEVVFSAEKLPIEEIKEFLIKNLHNNQNHYEEDAFFQVDENKTKAIKKIINSLQEASTFSELIEAFGCKKLEDCLDSL